ncbi:MAG: hypothetical protein ACLFU8_03900 [Anaerolineales bacterium]
MKRWLLLIISALLMFSLACSALEGLTGNDDEGDEVTAVVTEEVDGDEVEEDEAGSRKVVEPEETVEDDAADSIVLDANALEGLTSYRTRMVMRTEYEDGTIEEMILEEAATRDPQAQYISMGGVLSEEEDAGAIEMIQIGSTQWINFGGGWMQSEVGEDEVTGFGEESLISFEDFFAGTDEGDYDFVGKETVNGVATRHYELKLGPMDLLGLTAANDLDDIRGDVWVADEGALPAFPVRFIIEASGELEEGRRGTFTLEQDVTDINEPFTIDPPEDALMGGLPEDVPVYPEATDLTAMPGMVLFTVADDVATVGEFYTSNLEAAGWMQTETPDMEGMVMDTWEKDGTTLSLTVTENTEEGGSDIMILIEEAE